MHDETKNKRGHCLTGQYLQLTTRRPDAKCWWCNYKSQTREHLFKNCPQWKSQQEGGQRRNRPRRKPVKISELFADERCSKAILDFLATTEVGRIAGPPVADEEPGSEASEWEKREREGYLAQVAEEGGCWRGRKIRGRGLFLFYFMSTIERRVGTRRSHRDGDVRRIRSGGEKGFFFV